MSRPYKQDLTAKIIIRVHPDTKAAVVKAAGKRTISDELRPDIEKKYLKPDFIIELETTKK